METFVQNPTHRSSSVSSSGSSDRSSRTSQKRKHKKHRHSHSQSREPEISKAMSNMQNVLEIIMKSMFDQFSSRFLPNQLGPQFGKES
jgi:tRNA G10  N-methylase Trm11